MTFNFPIKSIVFDLLGRLFPVIEAEQSDSGCVDNVIEFLVMAGNRSLPEVSKIFLQFFNFQVSGSKKAILYD